MASCSTQASNAWCPRIGRSMTPERSGTDRSGPARSGSATRRRRGGHAGQCGRRTAPVNGLASYRIFAFALYDGFRGGLASGQPVPLLKGFPDARSARASPAEAIPSSLMTSSTSPSSGTSRTSAARGRGSPTSRSRSRSSPSWPAASPPTAPASPTEARSRSRGRGRSSVFHPDHRLHDVGAGLVVPDLGRHLLVGLEARRPPGRLLHRLAEPDRPGRGDGGRGLRVRHVHRPDHQHVLDVVLRTATR